MRNTRPTSPRAYSKLDGHRVNCPYRQRSLPLWIVLALWHDPSDARLLRQMQRACWGQAPLTAPKMKGSVLPRDMAAAFALEALTGRDRLDRQYRARVSFADAAAQAASLIQLRRPFGMGATWYGLVNRKHDMDQYPIEAREYVGQLWIDLIIIQEPWVTHEIARDIMREIRANFPQDCGLKSIAIPAEVPHEHAAALHAA